MANELDVSGLFRAAVELARRHDGDEVRAALYEPVLAELDAAMAKRDADLPLGAIEEIFAEHALPTAHLTQILKGL